MATRRISTKLLGDAGEHYALSQFSFAGIYAAKMPDNWEGYDLAVETGCGLVRVSVKMVDDNYLGRLTTTMLAG